MYESTFAIWVNLPSTVHFKLDSNRVVTHQKPSETVVITHHQVQTKVAEMKSPPTEMHGKKRRSDDCSDITELNSCITDKSLGTTILCQGNIKLVRKN